MKRKQICGGLLVAVSSCLAVGCGDIAKLVLNSSLESDNSPVAEDAPVEELRQMFEQVNELCPKQMDAFTTLESVKMIDDRRIEYKYRVNNEGKSLARRFDKDLLRKAAIKMMKGNAMAVAIAERDLSIEHIYVDAFGGHVLSFTINQQVLRGNPYPVGREHENPFGVQTVSAKSSDDVTVDPIVAPSEETELADPAKSAGAASEPLPVEPEPEPELPQAFKAERSEDNPAGIRANPFFD
jgi:hypothetical protein